MPSGGQAIRSTHTWRGRCHPALPKFSRCARPMLVTTPSSGRRNPRQPGDLSRVRHAHFDDRHLVLGLQAQQLHRQSKMIVEIAERFQNLESRAQHMRNAFLGGRLAGRAGHRDQLLAPQPPHRRAQMLQRLGAVSSTTINRDVSGKPEVGRARSPPPRRPPAEPLPRTHGHPGARP